MVREYGNHLKLFSEYNDIEKNLIIFPSITFFIYVGLELLLNINEMLCITVYSCMISSSVLLLK